MNGWKGLGTAVGLAVAVATMSACGTDGPTAASEVAAQLKVPDGNRLVSTMDATGLQVYQCTNGAWKPLEPAATLTADGKTAALHSRGPVWVSTVDGSAVNARPVQGASVARPNAVPELLLKATATRGDGVFGKVSYVQRLRTEGGLAPSGACSGDEQRVVAYTAVYTFYAPVR